MLTSETKIRVRYGEVDRMGYLHHGNYPLYFEEGRTDLIRQIGLSYREMEDKGILMPVRDMKIKYLTPVYYDDIITIYTSLVEKPSIKLHFQYQVIGQTGEIHCEAKTTLVFVDAESRKPIRCPVFFEKLLVRHYS